MSTQLLQEEHAENVFLVLRRIHVPAEIIACAEEEARQLAEGEFGHEKSASANGLVRS